jgi:enoyl-CoA hydratase
MTLRRQRFGRVEVLTIDRPEVRNALDPDTLHALADAIDELTADESVGAAVLTGAGTVCFTAGMDLRSVRDRSREEVSAAVRRFQGAMRSGQRLPLVAAVVGMAVGGGFEIMMLCDLVVASAGARLALPEVRRGLVPGGGGLLLPTRVPLQIALEIALLGQDITAERAYELGLVNRVRPMDEVLFEAVAMAELLAAQPPATLARIRELMWLTALEGPAAATAAAAEPPSARQAAETAAGIQAFTDKRG